MTSLIPILSIFTARPIEPTTLVCQPVVVIPVIAFTKTAVASIFLLLLFVFLGIIVIPVIPVLPVLTSVAIRILGSFRLASLVSSAWRKLRFHVSYYERRSVEHIIFTLLHGVSFRGTYWAIYPHVAIHRKMPGVEANGALNCLAEMVFLVLR